MILVSRLVEGNSFEKNSKYNFHEASCSYMAVSVGTLVSDFNVKKN